MPPKFRPAGRFKAVAIRVSYHHWRTVGRSTSVPLQRAHPRVAHQAPAAPQTVLLVVRLGNRSPRLCCRAERVLANGHVPESLQRTPKLAFSDLAGAIVAYLRARAAPATTTHVLATVSADIGTRKLNAVDYRWAEDWVRSRQAAHHRAPGTIRHQLGPLRAVRLGGEQVSHLLGQEPVAPASPRVCLLQRLWRKALAERGLDAKEDMERDRRLEADEEARIAAVLEARIAAEVDPTRRDLHTGALLMFRLALETAMRMRELFTLELKQVDVPRKTMFLTGTKNGLCHEDSCGSHCDPET